MSELTAVNTHQFPFIYQSFREASINPLCRVNIRWSPAQTDITPPPVWTLCM